MIEEYAAVACLCRLADGYPLERDAIRSALFELGGAQPAEDVRLRREAFALVLRFLPRKPGGLPGRRAAGCGMDRVRGIGRIDPSRPGDMPRTLGGAGRTGLRPGGGREPWVDGGSALQRADEGWGIGADSVARVLRDLVPTGELVLPAGPLPVAPDTTARAFADSIEPVAATSPLPDLARWAVKDGRAIAGLALLFALRARLPDPAKVPHDWRIVGGISGDRQPGLLALTADLDRQVEGGATLGDVMAWAVRHLVLLPHEWTAGSKLPEFTFRFRWEGSRLTFFTFLAQPFARFGLNDIRARSLTSLAIDLGLIERGGGAFALTPDGSRFVDEVFAG